VILVVLLLALLAAPLYIAALFELLPTWAAWPALIASAWVVLRSTPSSSSPPSPPCQ